MGEGWARPTGHSCTSLTFVLGSFFFPFNFIYHKNFPEILNILATR